MCVKTYYYQCEWGFPTHKSQLFWCELQGYVWFWPKAISIYPLTIVISHSYPINHSNIPFTIDISTINSIVSSYYLCLSLCTEPASCRVISPPHHWADAGRQRQQRQPAWALVKLKHGHGSPATGHETLGDSWTFYYWIYWGLSTTQTWQWKIHYVHIYIYIIGDFPIETTVSSGFPSASHVETKEGRWSSWDSLFPLLTKPMRKSGDIMIQ